MQKIPTTNPNPIVGLSLWVCFVGFGFSFIWQYQWTPGQTPERPPDWPSDSKLTLHEQKPTLIMFVHPQCPCSRSSFAELERLLIVCSNRAKYYVVFLQPHSGHDDWKNSSLWRRALELPNVITCTDVNGSEARLFRVSVSGHVLLYRKSGELCFTGGITESRAHEGDNAGRSQLQRLIIGSRSKFVTWPVYGCPLY